MHSLPDDWEFTIMGMEKILPDGKYKIKVALDGLVKKDMFLKSKSKIATGNLGEMLLKLMRDR